VSDKVGGHVSWGRVFEARPPKDLSDLPLHPSHVLASVLLAASAALRPCRRPGIGSSSPR